MERDISKTHPALAKRSAKEMRRTAHGLRTSATYAAATVVLFAAASCSSAKAPEKTFIGGETEEIRLDFGTGERRVAAMANDGTTVSGDGAMANGMPADAVSGSFGQDDEATKSAIAQIRAPEKLSEKISEYVYEDGRIYEINIGTDFITDMRLEPGETPSGEIAVGDASLCAIESATSTEGGAKTFHVFIKALRNAGTTDAIIPTDKRTYYLKLAATGDEPMFAVRFKYVSGIRLTAASGGTRLTNLKDLNFDYSVSGDKTIRPVRAFSDASCTYIQFPVSFAKSMASPALYLNSNGLSIINYTIRGNIYIAETLLADRESFILMQDGKKAEVKRL